MSAQNDIEAMMSAILFPPVGSMFPQRTKKTVTAQEFRFNQAETTVDRLSASRRPGRRGGGNNRERYFSLACFCEQFSAHGGDRPPSARRTRKRADRRGLAIRATGPAA